MITALQPLCKVVLGLRSWYVRNANLLLAKILTLLFCEEYELQVIYVDS